MQIKTLHKWNLDYQKGLSLQKKLSSCVRQKPLPKSIRLVAGADVAFDRKSELFFASVVVLSFPRLKMVEEVWAHHPSTFPYIPGLLSFREGPVLLKAFEQLKLTPDVVVFDGQGLAHPRRLGLACHMGLWLGIPSIGCAKSRLVGESRQLGNRRGASEPLVDNDDQVGVVLRTKDNVKPVYVSPGHFSDFETSTQLMLSCSPKYRIPEPTRLADIRVAQVKRKYLEKSGANSRNLGKIYSN